MEQGLTLHHVGDLLPDASSEGARVPRQTAGGKDSCLHLHLVMGLQAMVDAAREDRGSGSGHSQHHSGPYLWWMLFRSATILAILPNTLS